MSSHVDKLSLADAGQRARELVTAWRAARQRGAPAADFEMLHDALERTTVDPRVASCTLTYMAELVLFSMSIAAEYSPDPNLGEDEFFERTCLWLSKVENGAD
jgi:hypothetical protein